MLFQFALCIVIAALSGLAVAVWLTKDEDTRR